MRRATLLARALVLAGSSAGRSLATDATRFRPAARPRPAVTHLAAPRSAPRQALRRPAGRDDPAGGQRRKLQREAVPRHQPARALARRRARPALDRLPPALRAQPPLLRRLHRANREHTTSSSTARTRTARPRCRSTARQLFVVRSRAPSTRAASSRSARRQALRRRSATASAATTRRTAPRTWAEPFGKLLRIDVAHEAPRRDRRARPAQPLALLVRPRDRRPLHRRRRRRPVGGDRLPAARAARRARQLRLGRWEARAVKEAKDAEPRGPARLPASTPTTHHGRPAARSPAASSTAARPCPRRAAATSSATTAPATIWSLRMVERRGDGRAPRAGHDPRPVDVRRGRARRALRRLGRHRPGVPARPLELLRSRRSRRHRRRSSSGGRLRRRGGDRRRTAAGDLTADLTAVFFAVCTLTYAPPESSAARTLTVNLAVPWAPDAHGPQSGTATGPATRACRGARARRAPCRSASRRSAARSATSPRACR